MKLLKKIQETATAEKRQYAPVETKIERINFPKDLETTRDLNEIGFNQGLLFALLLKQLSEVGDSDDLHHILGKLAEDFTDIILSSNNFISTVSDDNLSEAVEELNKLLMTFHLGFIQLSVPDGGDPRERVEVWVSHSIFYPIGKLFDINIAALMTSFYEALFIPIFSNILQADVTVRKKDTLTPESGDAICIFEVMLIS